MKAAPERYQVRVENGPMRVAQFGLLLSDQAGQNDGSLRRWQGGKPGGSRKVKEDGWKPEGPHPSENLGKTRMRFIVVEVRSAVKPAK